MEIENILTESSKGTPIEEVLQNPTPDMFDVFIPWACKEFHVEVNIIVTSIQDKRGPTSNNSTKRSKLNKNTQIPSLNVKASKENVNDNINRLDIIQYDSNDVQITTVYDVWNNLIKVNFVKNKRIPRQVLQVIALALPYHPKLVGISANKGIDAAFMYELNKILKLSTITNVCLDGTNLVDVSYEVLLENENHLSNLSLARCKIDDNAVERLASKLIDQLPASKSLALLNLATNKITDKGATHIADALKSNRQLVYLNIADNALSDIGAAAILDVLCEFQVPNKELLSDRLKQFNCWKEKIALDDSERVTENKKSLLRKTSRNANAHKKKAAEKDATKVSAEVEYEGPFTQKNVFVKDGVLFCYGNNRLANLNLSFNDISYITVKKLLTVVSYQKMVNRKPRGLVTVSVEGNCIPVNCMELRQIDEILNGFFNTSKRISTHKRKQGQQDSI